MKRTSPVNCCFCVPLRKGLLCIGYIRLIICLMFIVQHTWFFITLLKRMQTSYDSTTVTFLEYLMSIVPLLLDLIFTLMFIVAAHKKNLKLFELYYFYSVTMLFVYLLVVVLTICDVERFNVLYFMMFQYTIAVDFGYYELIVCGALTIVLQAYLTLLVRSEVNKLREHCRAELARQKTCSSFRLPKFNVTDV